MELLKDHGKTALVARGREISYGEVIEKASSFGLLSGVSRGDRALLVMENRPEWVYALYGVWSVGGVVVPVDFLSSPEEIAFVAKDAEPKVVFYSEETAPRVEKALKGSSVRLVKVEEAELPPPGEFSLKPEEEELALLPYTSGTTGTPKGVMLTFGNLFSNIRAVEKVGIAGREDRTLAVLPFHHTYPLMTTLLLPLYLGATVVFLDKLSPEDIMEKLRRYKITVFVGVPRLYELFASRIRERIEENPVAKLLFNLSLKVQSPSLGKKLFKKVQEAFGGELKYMVSGGAKLPLSVAKELTALGFTVIEGYGLTETSPIVSFNPPQKVKLGSVGKPIEGVEVRLTEEGEVLVKGPNVMRGYWKKPEETAKVLKEGWLYTGDLGSLDEEGYLYITGRKKELIVLPSGKNVFPEEIEEKILKRAPFIKEVGVFERGGKLYALVYPDLQKVKEFGIVNLSETVRWEVIDKVNRELPEWKRIAGFRIVKEELPKTRLGKLRRFLLPQVYERAQEKRGEEGEEELLREEEGRILKEYLEKVSGLPVGTKSHLELDLGLDSLAKVELLSFIEKSFGVKLSEEELAEHLTVGELLNLVKSKKAKAVKEEVSWRDILLNAPPYELPHYPVVFEAGILLLRAYFKLYHRLEVKGLENLPEPPFIIAPNHQSYLDAFAVGSSLPLKVARETYFLGDEKYFSHPLTALFARLAHVITVNVNKGLKESLQKTAYALSQGKVVVVFPEGARTRTGRLMEFKKGVAILAKELEVPVVPVGIKGAYEAWSVYDKFPKPRKIILSFGKPLKASPEEDYQSFTHRLEEAVSELLK